MGLRLVGRIYRETDILLLSRRIFCWSEWSWHGVDCFMVMGRMNYPLLESLEVDCTINGQKYYREIQASDRCMGQILLKYQSLSHVLIFATPGTIAHQAPLYMGFSRQEYWSGLPFPSPGDLPDPRIKPSSPAWQADALLSESLGKIILKGSI